MMHQPSNPLILASQSPRRREILKNTGLTFTVLNSDFDEESVDIKGFDAAEDYALFLADQKGQTVCKNNPDALVISADTIVVHNRKILGKPNNIEAAKKMLRQLSGAEHQVITALVIRSLNNNVELKASDSTSVVFRELSEKDILDYINNYEPLDKAGGYGIQDVGAALVREIHGCYFNVVGFPLALFYELWQKLSL